MAISGTVVSHRWFAACKIYIVSSCGYEGTKTETLQRSNVDLSVCLPSDGR